MRFVSCLSQEPDADSAVDQLIDQSQTDGLKPDVLFVFLDSHHREQAGAILEKLWLKLDPQVAIGCSAEGVIARDIEVEREPAIALLIGQTPGVRVHPFHISADDWRPMLADPDLLVERARFDTDTRALIGFGDPYTTPLNQFLELLDFATPGAPLIGGMASGARKAGGNVLLRNDEILTDGFVGVSFAGPIQVDTLVSQGARPIGKPMVVTKGRENVIEQLGGKPPLAALRDIVDTMTPEEKELLGHGLLIGRVMTEYKDTFGRGDFVVRNVMGIDENAGAMAVTDYVRVGQTVQFHVRDAATASEDLSAMLQSQSSLPSPAGALLFSCNGRGTRMFPATSHDVTAAKAAMPQTPVAGFFAAGEIGPVAGKNFVHGHTASFALFRAK